MTEKMTDADWLEALLEERAFHESEVQAHRKRISELNRIMNGDGNNIGLLVKVQAQKRLREWQEAEPERAAMRATTEWQTWRREFLKSRGRNPE